MTEVVIKTQEYGKDLVRLFKMTKKKVGQEEVYEIFDFTCRVLLQGPEFEVCYRSEDNSAIVATDTVKNTIYVLAYKHAFKSKEEFAHIIVDHFFKYKQVERVNVNILENHWDRLPGANKAPAQHPFSFLARSDESTVSLVASKDGTKHFSIGLRNIKVLKGTESSFFGFSRDSYTTLPDVNDRIFSTKVNVDYSLAPFKTAVDYTKLQSSITEIILDVFANSFSPSVQFTLYEMGKKVLERVPEVVDISFAMPNIHHFHVDLSPFGLDNTGNNRTIYNPVNQPSGLITATLARKNPSKL